MSRLTDLIAQAKAKDPQMGADLEREYKALSSRLPFGLNFERHRPEAVELPQRPIRKGDKVLVLPERGSSAKRDLRLWVVKKIVKERGKKLAELELLDAQADPFEETSGSMSYRGARQNFSDVRQQNMAGGGGGLVGPLHSVGRRRQPRPGGGMAGG